MADFTRSRRLLIVAGPAPEIIAGQGREQHRPRQWNPASVGVQENKITAQGPLAAGRVKAVLVVRGTRYSTFPAARRWIALGNRLSVEPQRDGMRCGPLSQDCGNSSKGRWSATPCGLTRHDMTRHGTSLDTKPVMSCSATACRASEAGSGQAIIA